MHGLVREILALASWVVAFIVAQMFASDVAALLPAALTNPSLRLLAGFLAVFLAVFVVMTLLAIAVSGLIKSAGLGFADRVLGARVRACARAGDRHGCGIARGFDHCRGKRHGGTRCSASRW